MRSLFLAATLVLVSGVAHAELISRDLFEPGDSRLTFDAQSDLEWLAPALTMGPSIDEMLAGAGGWLDSGWRYATSTDLCGLLIHSGVGCSGSLRISSSLAVWHGAENLIGRLGPTTTGGGLQVLFDDEDDRDPRWGGLLLGTQRGGAIGFQTFVSLGPNRRDPSLSTAPFPASDGIGGGSGFGHLFVRDAIEPLAGIVPEPHSALLFLASLGVLLRVRFSLRLQK